MNTESLEAMLIRLRNFKNIVKARKGPYKDPRNVLKWIENYEEKLKKIEEGTEFVRTDELKEPIRYKYVVKKEILDQQNKDQLVNNNIINNYWDLYKQLVRKAKKDEEAREIRELVQEIEVCDGIRTMF